MRLRVRFAETDAAGIVHYARYLAFLEAGRAEAYRAAGLSTEMLVACTLQAPVIEAVLHYRAAARFDDVLEIRTRAIDSADSRFGFAYEIRREADQLLIASCETVHAWTGPGQTASEGPPAWLLNALERLRE